jgi:hypothetical protein
VAGHCPFRAFKREDGGVSVIENSERATQTAEVSDAALARRAWDLRERVAELETELDQRIERDRIRELELASQRRELEVRFAYNAALEQRVLEHKQELDWMHQQFAAQAQGIASEQERAAGEIAAERERVSAEHERAERLERERDAVLWELAAERGRVSYQLVQRVAARARKHRVVYVTLRRTARVFSG